MTVSRRFWKVFGIAWIGLALVPCIRLMGVDVQIGWLMLAHVYLAGLTGESIGWAWPWIVGHVATALVVAAVVTLVRGGRPSGS